MKRALLLCVGLAVLPACASETSADQESSAAATTLEGDDTPEDVASVAAEGADHLIARAVFGVTKLRDDNGRKQVFAHVRYYDKDGVLLGYGAPQANANGATEFALVRVTPGTTNEDARFSEEARVLTERLAKDVDAHGCSVGKGILRAVGRFIGGLVVGTVGLVIAVALSPVYLVILIASSDEPESRFVDVTVKPYLVGLQLLKGSFKPCRALPVME
jgi:hypothetical protein